MSFLCISLVACGVVLPGQVYGQATGLSAEQKKLLKSNILHFNVSNKFAPASQEIKDEASGIGLVNVRRRLDLLYPKNYTLQLLEKGDEYIVSLQINLSA